MHIRPAIFHDARRPAALILLAALIGFLVVPVAAGSAHAEEIDADGSLTTRAQSTVTLSVPVPIGATPTGVRGTLEVAPGVTGRLEFKVGNRVSREVPARSAPNFVVPVRAADLDANNNLAIRMTYSPTNRCPDGTAPADVVLRDLRLRYTGTPTPPGSLAAFFPAATSRVDVVVPGNASDEVIAAGLTAVAALSSKYDDQTPVTLNPASVVLPRVDVTQRVVRIVAGSGPVTTQIANRFGLSTLILTGSGQDLVAAAQALGSDQLDLATGGTSSGLAETLKVRDASMTQTLADLGAPTVKLAGPATVTQYVGVRQDAFGGPVDSLRIRVKGTHTALPPGTSAQLNTYLNGFLLDSQVLDDASTLTIDTTADASLVSADNGLEFTLTTAGSEDCSGEETLPIEVYFDGERSTVTATRGSGQVTGFQTFPQVLGGELPVALRPGGPDRLQAAVDAAQIVSALQRAAASPLNVTLVDADEFLDDNLSGLLVGALESDATDLRAPLRLDGMRLVDYAEASFRVGTDQPYAAFQAISNDGRDVLMLGSWAPTGADVSNARSAAATYVATRGWNGLSDDLLVAAGQRRPFTLSSNAVVPQAEVIDERRPFIWWLVAGFVVLALLLVYQVWRTNRRDREVRQLVDAQVRADGTRDDDLST